tara:strand:+ start:2215 stop:2583 length:369 start_codon:yes stop_codon:yes gene_type:complete
VATTVLDNVYFTTKFFYETDLDTGPFNNVTNGAASVYSITILNGGNANDLYLKIYDTSEEITANSTSPDYVYRISSSKDATITFGTSGLRIVNGLTVRLVQGQAVSSVDDPQANIVAEITYS